MILQLILLFLVGLIECFIITLHTKFIQNSRIFLSSITCTVNIFIWWYVIRVAVKSDGNIAIIIFYTLGFILGNTLALKFNTFLEGIIKK